MLEYEKEIHEDLLRIESLLKNLIKLKLQENKEETTIKRSLNFPVEQLTIFKEEREKLRKTESFKCYWNNEKRTWVYDGDKKVLASFVTALQKRGIKLEIEEV
ncbi:MAG: hypothetical protein ACTSSG_11325 [Candidatus Heimdallarchaeaceae archaeon]